MDKVRRVAVLLIALFTIQFEYTEAISVDDCISYVDASQCTEKLHVSLNELFNAPSNQSYISPILKCFAGCVLEYAGLMRGCLVGDNGSKYKFIKGIPKELVLESVQECSVNIAELDDPCECGFEMGKCIGGRLPEEL